jgi:hypothetical protein
VSQNLDKKAERVIFLIKKPFGGPKFCNFSEIASWKLIYIIFAGHSKRSGGPKMVLVAPSTKLPGELSICEIVEKIAFTMVSCYHI